jgi:hypothetical protein
LAAGMIHLPILGLRSIKLLVCAAAWVTCCFHRRLVTHRKTRPRASGSMPTVNCDKRLCRQPDNRWRLPRIRSHARQYHLEMRHIRSPALDRNLLWVKILITGGPRTTSERLLSEL